jgi:hypothetical protein
MQLEENSDVTSIVTEKSKKNVVVTQLASKKIHTFNPLVSVKISQLQLCLKLTTSNWLTTNGSRKRSHLQLRTKKSMNLDSLIQRPIN